MQQMDCTRKCWVTGAIAGLLVWLFTWMTGALSPLAALLFGLLTLWFLASFLIWGLCRGAGDDGDVALLSGSASWSEPAHPTPLAQRPAEAVMPANPAPQPKTPPQTQPVTQTAQAQPAASVTKAAGTAQGATATAARVSAADMAGDAPDDAKAAPETAVAQKAGKTTKAATKTADAPAAKPAKKADKKADKKTAQDKKPAKAAKSGEAKGKAAAKTAKPAKAKKTKAKPDDLKQIKGIGPKLETWLTGQGITRFAEIAALSDAEQDDLADKMGRMGARIRSDDWVGQARLLAQGGETEFSKRVEKGGVYE